MPFAPSDMTLTSPAFGNGDVIPTRHSGEGEDRSPALKWSGAPAGTAGFAVVCHDPDAPLVSPGGTYGFVHWALYNLPAEVTSLEEATAIGTAGINDVGNIGYNGPMPPAGHGVHRYYFWVIALDAVTDLPEGLTLWQLLERIEPNILGMNRLVGTYQR
ncbi:YbhB/YbcL family Raf kinase inhibitor-like protein [Thiohalospira sp.]|uniref:YbhB/YbcL family Raf kinase inhibitor-like protein n=1 Tax=Thiohalospira sp. TaxID=3080549 RepID=UPI003980CCED